MKSIEKDPFRLFFPLGALFALVGVLPWVTQIPFFSTYPAEFHKIIMMNGFMLSFVIGFLMTAIPRFTSTNFANIYEVAGITFFLLLATISEILNYKFFHHLLIVVTLISLVVFAYKRFKLRKCNPPYTFIFIGVGLFLWTVSNVTYGLTLNLEGYRPSPLTIWSDLFSNGALMSIVLGVGGRLIPGILGWQEIVLSQREQYEKPVPFLKVVPPVVWMLVSLYICSFIFQPLLPISVFLLMRAVVINSFAFIFWKIYKLPKEKSYLTWAIWISCWCFALGSITNVFWHKMYTHSLHIILVGGFSLLTILVATRVTLAHGSEGTGSEKTSLFFPLFTFFIFLAMITRVTAPLFFNSYLNHLSYAALAWIIGFIFWVVFSAPKIINKR